MMRIQAHQSGKKCTLTVEGEIEGLAAVELQHSWQRLDCAGSTVTVDFTGVIHMDRNAKALLRSMHESGVRFIGARWAIRDMLEEITASKAPIDNDV